MGKGNKRRPNFLPETGLSSPLDLFRHAEPLGPKTFTSVRRLRPPQILRLQNLQIPLHFPFRLPPQ